MRTYASMIALTTMLVGVAACGNGSDNANDSTEVRPLEGVYDTTVGTTGMVFARDPEGVSIFLHLGNDASVSFGGPVSADGSLSGPSTFLVTDILFQGTGEAVFSESAGVAVVSGSVDATNTPFERFDHVTFTMRRPRDADARGFGGTYRVTLEPSPGPCACTSTLDLALTFEASGITSMIGTAIERGDDGTMLGSLEGVSGSISPEGRLRVTASYDPAGDTLPESVIVALIGAVDASGAIMTASGETFAGFTPANRVGTWTAERIEGGPVPREVR